jgi:glutamyl-tRNA synthetase
MIENKKIRTRFAPSPSGFFHVGSARTALFNYLFAKKYDGKFLLRIEDTDLERSTEESVQSILQGLEWLGLKHDEEIVFQSDNKVKHQQYVRKLISEGKAYYDFTPKGEEVDNHRKNPYRDMSQEEVDKRIFAGKTYCVRLKVPDTNEKVSFVDGVYGLQERSYTDIEDLVLLRGDLSPLYNLSVVCDDAEMRISHVIRGQDHLTNTHKQILIYEALGFPVPQFAHLPLILAPNKGKLSKRKHGEVVSMTTYRDKGFLPEAFINFLAFLGWNPKDGTEILSIDSLIEKFSLDGINKNNAIVNFSDTDERKWTDDKAIWMNAEYIRTMPIEDLLPLVADELNSNGINGIFGSNGFLESEFAPIVDLIRQRFFTLKDFSTQGRAFFSNDYNLNQDALKKWQLPENVIKEIQYVLEGIEFEKETLLTAFNSLAVRFNLSLGKVLNGIRVLVTGQGVGADMISILILLGKEKVLDRL